MSAMMLLSAWQSSQVEFWRPIRGFPGYDVSSFGRIRTKRCILNGSGHKQGYMVATLIGPVRRQTFMIHRLVATAFLPNDSNAPEVNHLTGVKHDNRVGNLEWVTRKENQQHAWRSGLITPNRVRLGQGWLSKTFSEQDVINIRERRAIGESCESLCREYGVSNGCISEMVTGTTFAEVGGPRTARHHFFRLSDQDVRKVRVMVSTKAATQHEIARLFNIDPSDVSRIAARKRYAHVA